ncbi:MAG: D-alanyl-D-alanine carboxypeptidase [uncultured Quadrisphaera sp.]|uniref:D-alanyl-D-alanine carboxypeptidase n=1 Tax=uncultured Quadrisphaera sp. TaxID=904978 RepID=A0A6J4PG85_9ACTN|nr:MAG: D-alanyl-D-alanine carboxypeptidase [uncultured Quadrisphaera sp.]
MDGPAGVEARIAEIQGRIAALSAPARPPVAGGPAFGTALAQAVTGTSAASTAAPGVLGPTAALTAEDHLAAARLRSGAPVSGGLTADGAPQELAGYGNGKVPASALSPIGQGSHRLWAPAAEAFERMHAAAARDGVEIGVTDSYRSYEAQVDLAERKGLYSQGGLAAKPGTSDHGWGRALDLDLDGRAQAWMRANGAQHGFVEDTPREPWHWAFTPVR